MCFFSILRLCRSTHAICGILFSSLLCACSVQPPATQYYSNFTGQQGYMQAQQYPKYNPYKKQEQTSKKYKVLQTTPSARPLPQHTQYANRRHKIPAHYKPYVVFGKEYYPLFDARGYVETGLASWYGPNFHGKKTSNGETYNMYAETAAHKTLPMGTIVKVTNLENKKSMILRINDRGPFVGDRIIDLSKTAADKLDIYQKGTGLVKVEVIQAPPPLQARHAGTYYLQVGAFSDKNKASTIRRSIENKGFPTRLIPTQNQQIWRVQVGPMKKLAETTKTRKLLTQDFPESYIVLE